MLSSQPNTATAPLRLRERRNDFDKRSTVEFGISAAQHNLISGVEYLQRRDIDAGIIMRVLCALLARRLSTQALHGPQAHYPRTPHA